MAWFLKKLTLTHWNCISRCNIYFKVGCFDQEYLRSAFKFMEPKIMTVFNIILEALFLQDTTRNLFVSSICFMVITRFLWIFVTSLLMIIKILSMGLTFVCFISRLPDDSLNFHQIFHIEFLRLLICIKSRVKFNFKWNRRETILIKP